MTSVILNNRCNICYNYHKKKKLVKDIFVIILNKIDIMSFKLLHNDIYIKPITNINTNK